VFDAGSATDPLATRLAGTVVALLRGSGDEAMAVAAELDLSLSQLRILFTLERCEDALPVGDLAERIALSSAAGRAVAALHRGGFVPRREDPADRRVKRVALADAGREATERVAAARLAAAERFVAALDDAERARLGDAVDVLAGLVAGHLPSAAPCAAPIPSVPELQR